MSSKKTRVVIVRHGQSSYNKEQRIQGRCNDSILTEKGQTDAIKLGDVLSNLSFDYVFCSPLQRAKHTAEIILSRWSNPPVLNPDPNLMEIDLPLWEKMLKTDVKSQFPNEYKDWHNSPDKFFMELVTPEGENTRHFPILALYEQAKKFWENLIENYGGSTVLIVAHNGINRALISTALEVHPSQYQSIQQSNCGITVLNFSGKFGDSVQLESMNLTSHVGDLIPKPRPQHEGGRLLLVRHGETQWNKETRFQGQIDVPLNENGKLQSQKAADFLKDIKIDCAFTSPMLRPKETAQIILQYHPDVKLEDVDGLKEISHGLWEGKLESEIDQEFPNQLDVWRLHPETVQMPEGENLQDVSDRSIIAWEKIVNQVSKEQKTALVVAHDATNKVILCHLLKLGLGGFWKIKQGNGAVTVIDYPHGLDDIPVLQAMNITTHLTGSILDQTAAGAL